MGYAYMKKIKVLFHTQPNLSSFNAQDLNGREIASRLDSSLFEIYFIDRLGGEIDPKLKKENIKILRVKSRNKILNKLELFTYKLLYKYDVSFYIRVFKNEKRFFQLLPFFDSKRKTIHMVENMLPYPNSDKEYQETAKYNALHSSKVYSISTKVQESVKREYGIDTDIIPVGVDTSLFMPVEFDKKRNTRLKILSVGTFQKRKQPELFADIAKRFSECDFYWIGEGELKSIVTEKKRVERIDNLFLLDNMQHSELSKFMSSCDIFLFPSIHEGFPKVIVEAMASGLPVIAFDKYGPEAVIDSKTGFVVSNKDKMIKKLELLIKNKNLRKEYSQNAIQRAKEFDWKIVVKKWEEVIFNLLNRA